MIYGRFSDQFLKIRNSYLLSVFLFRKIARTEAAKPDSFVGHCPKLLVQTVTLTGVVTSPKGYDSGKGVVVAINIDPDSKPAGNEPNSSRWHQAVHYFDGAAGTTGITAAPLNAENPETTQILFTNRYTESEAIGVITIQEGNFDGAQVRFSDLNLGSANDYFDVNEAVDITITHDGKYAFVSGRNSRQLGSEIPSVDGDRRAGGNIGIIKSPLTSDIDLIAATRPIPDGWTFSTDLSKDGKSLFATYPGIGSTFVFDVDEIINTVENPGDYTIDYWGRGSDYPDSLSVIANYLNDPSVPVNAIFNPARGVSAASREDFSQYPIDNINPRIAIASDLRSLTALPHPISGDISYGVLEGSKRGPISTGGNPTGVTTASTPNLEASLISPLTATRDLTPTFQWQFDENIGAIKEVNLFVSAYPEGEGLLPWDRFVNLSDRNLLPDLSVEQKREFLSDTWNTVYDDFNPGRILTATWKEDSSTWLKHDRQTSFGRTWAANDVANSSTSFTLPETLRLTASQNVYWAVQVIGENGTTDIEFGKFATESAPGDTPFSAVTVLTHGFTISPTATGIPESHYEMASYIAKE